MYSYSQKTMERTVAGTILDQISPAILHEKNARDFVALEKNSGVQFRIRGGKKIVIKLDEATDTYNVEIWKVQMEPVFICEKIEEMKDIYCDQLGEVVSRA